MNRTDTELLEFPCEFPIKVMGRDEADFESEVLAIFERHLEDMARAAVQSRPSSNGNFVSITVTFTARSKEQLDALYKELTDHDKVLFCL